MEVNIYVELRNGAARGNTTSKVITIDDEDLKDLDKPQREDLITEIVGNYVTDSLVWWNWNEVTDGD